MKRIKFILSCVVFLFSSYGITWSSELTKNDLSKMVNDTNKVNALNKLSTSYYAAGDFNRQLHFAQEALSLSKKLNWKKGIAFSEKNIGSAYEHLENYPLALESYVRALKNWKIIGNNNEVSFCYNGILIVQINQGDYAKALKNAFAYLKFSERLNDWNIKSNAYNSIGNIYTYQGNYQEGINYFEKALALYEKQNDKQGIAIALNNLGSICRIAGQYDKAAEMLNRSLTISIELNDSIGVASANSNLGLLYFSQGKYDKSIEYNLKGLAIDEARDDLYEMAGSYINTAAAYLYMNNYTQTRKYLKKGIELAQSIGSKDFAMTGYMYLYALDSILGNWKEHAEHYKVFISYRDSIENEENTRISLQAQMQYDFDKKAMADSVVHAEEIRIKEVKLASEKTQRYALYGGISLVIVFALFIFNRFKITQKQKKLIENKERETQKQKETIEEKQKEIIDSIHYAQRIQKALLPLEKSILRDLERLKKLK